MKKGKYFAVLLTLGACMLSAGLLLNACSDAEKPTASQEEHADEQTGNGHVAVDAVHDEKKHAENKDAHDNGELTESTDKHAEPQDEHAEHADEKDGHNHEAAAI